LKKYSKKLFEFWLKEKQKTSPKMRLVYKRKIALVKTW